MAPLTDLVVLDDVDTCLLLPAEGSAGGPIEVLVFTAGGRGLAPMEETRAFDGVPVLGFETLGGAVIPSCFVGDLVGDCHGKVRIQDMRGGILV